MDLLNYRIWENHNFRESQGQHNHPKHPQIIKMKRTSTSLKSYKIKILDLELIYFKEL